MAEQEEHPVEWWQEQCRRYKAETVEVTQKLNALEADYASLQMHHKTLAQHHHDLQVNANIWHEQRAEFARLFDAMAAKVRLTLAG